MTLKTASLKERLDHLFALIKSDRFLKMQGLGNEVPFFICPFDPAETNTFLPHVGRLANRLKENGVTVLTIDLYDLALDLIQQRGVWDRLKQIEPTVSQDQFKELLQGILDPETHLVPAMNQRMQAHPHFDVLFVTGVGEVYPYIRSHNVLNNLQSKASHHPTVFFFPGKYTHSLASGASLDLFGRLQDDKYYRAFNIYDVSTGGAD